tara:strand:- start:694 stop:1215 length:522 start_codon:yes stop_codon:yes gene_type:complete
MVKLANGRGQLGEKLSKEFKDFKTDGKVAIYHTWKVPHLHDPAPGQEENIQQNEYDKLVQFCKENPKTKIIFISTNSNRSTWYTYYKELAEAYLLLQHKDCIILKFPLFIGKGVLSKLKSGKLSPYGISEIITLDEVIETIKGFINYKDLKRVFYIEGEKVKASTIVDILKVK